MSHHDTGAVSPATEFLPHVLRQYAVLADGERGAVVGPRGDVAWMCAPRWDSDAVFSSLVGGYGTYAVHPEDPWFVWGGYYEHGTLIWHSRWTTPEGVFECREALAYPGDSHRAVVLRRVVGVDCAGRVRVLIDPRAGFGRHRAHWERTSGGDFVGRAGPLWLRWRGAPTAAPLPGREGALVATLDVQPGEYHDLVLEIADEHGLGDPVDPVTAWRETERAWLAALPDCADTAAPREAKHAYAVLRGLTSRTGGMVAAATTSLPERADEGRNYDYRYVWIRDQCFAGQAIAAHGAHPLVDDAVAFVSGRLLADGPTLTPAYTIAGDPVPEERTLSLRGYPGGVDIVGNRVGRQFQLDAFGEALQLFAAAARVGRLSEDGRRAVDVAVRAVEKRWRERDTGVWELDERRWAHSRLACVAGLRSAAAYVPASRGESGKWAELADTLLADAAGDCLHPSGRWQRSPGDSRVDAALLLPPIRGALSPEDPRSVATLAAVQEELSEQGYVYRFRHGDRPLGEAEGAFLLCGFVMALAAHQRGDTLGAYRWFERGRSACGPPGLYTEEFDVTQRQLRANLPQAFVHALLLECATVLAGHGHETARMPRDGA